MLERLARPEFVRARVLFNSAEQIDGTKGHRGALLARLDLYRQASHWGLAALAPEGTRGWPALLTAMPQVPEETARILAAPPELDEQLDDAQLAQALTQVSTVARSVMEVAQAPDPAAEDARWHRWVAKRAAILIAVLVLVPVIVIPVRHALAPKDLAEGRPWRASSKLADCHPAQIECAGTRTAIFFHTLQENEPWVEIDLGKPTTFRTVSVLNRSDGYGDRAFPLQLEVSDDQREWKALARQETDVRAWTIDLPPTTARFVRLKAMKSTLLHLNAVRIYP